MRSHYKNVETYSHNSVGDKIISYNLDGDSSEDVCYSLVVKGDYGEESEVTIHACNLEKIEEVLRILTELRRWKCV